MDRDAIERRDFPVGRRGYDQAAVDAHLRAVADAFETVRARPAPAAAPLSAGASEQVRVILEAAEAGAARVRADAEREAGEHVARVQDAANATLSRLDDLERELATLRDALRRSADQLTGELARFRQEIAPATTADPGEPPARGEDFAAAAPAGTTAGDATPEAPGGADAVATAGDDNRVAPTAPGAAAPAKRADGVAADNGDEAGARLIAFNMALSGTPREETAKYLAEHFALGDADALLDDVYTRAGR